MKIAILGLGLIGGSIASDLKRQMNVQVFGIDSNPEHEKIALEKNLVDSVIGLDEACQVASLLILAVPVNIILALLPSILDAISKDTVVMDTGSTKHSICKSISNHPKRGRFVATHPLAGTEYSGPQAALNGLFNEKKTILCEVEKSDHDAIQTVLALNQALGLTTIFLSPEEHDRHLAYVSHLSHVTSFALSKTVLDLEKDDQRIFSLAGSGFSSTVRLAKSNPITWTAIFKDNQSFLLEALDAYLLQLQEFRAKLLQQQTDKIEEYLRKSQEIQRII